MLILFHYSIITIMLPISRYYLYMFLSVCMRLSYIIKTLLDLI